MQAITIGLGIAKSVFQVHIEDAQGRIVLQKQLRRTQVEAFFAKHPPAVIGIEACGSAHYWGRTLRALGHEVKLIPAAYVKPFVKRNKTDARDAAAICAALGRPDMRFVPIKTIEQQGMRGVERARDLLVKQHIQLVNSVRGMMAEFGIVTAQGRRGFAELEALIKAGDERVPKVLVNALRLLLTQIEALSRDVAVLEKKIMAVAQADPVMRLLNTIPGIGGLTAHAIVAAIGDGRQFGSARDFAARPATSRLGPRLRGLGRDFAAWAATSRLGPRLRGLGRDFAAWAGLTPRERSSAGKRSQGGISRQGDSRLRKLFALGASTIMRNARSRQDSATLWQRGILSRRPMKVAVLAQAAKTARIAWSMLTSGKPYRHPEVQTVAA